MKFDYANQRQASKSDLTFIAGLFAGEGYITYIPGASNGFPSLRVGLANTESWMAEMLHGFFGGFVWLDIPGAKRNNKKIMFGWVVTGKAAVIFLQALKPFLKGEKLPQLELGLEFMERKDFFYRQGRGKNILDKKETWDDFAKRKADLRCAAAETNQRDAVRWRSDSPNLVEISE